MWKITINRFVVTASIFGLIACSAHQQGPELQEGQNTPGAIGNVVNLEQGWTVDTQQAFYNTSQGSRIMPYSWYINLEQAKSETLFRANELSLIHI